MRDKEGKFIVGHPSLSNGSFHKGQSPWNKGKKMSKVYREKLSSLHKQRVIEGKVGGLFKKGKDPRRIKGQYKKGQLRLEISGILNPNWKGGTSLVPYDKKIFSEEFKKNIKIRDCFACLKCGKREEQEIRDFNRALAIHHIDYNKWNSVEKNCCTLCIRCNGEVNVNRIHWTKFFQSLLNENFGYEYKLINTLKNEN